MDKEVKEEDKIRVHKFFGIEDDKKVSQIILILKDSTPDKPFKLGEVAELDSYQAIGHLPTGSVAEVYGGSANIYLISKNPIKKSPEEFSAYIQSFLRKKYGDRFSVLSADKLHGYAQSDWFKFIKRGREMELESELHEARGYR